MAHDRELGAVPVETAAICELGVVAHICTCKAETRGSRGLDQGPMRWLSKLRHWPPSLMT